MAVPEQAAPRLRIVYRSHGGENMKRRPPYYSKMLSLASLVRAAQAVDTTPEVVFVNDGPIPPGRLDLMRRTGETVEVQAGSNRRSYRTALSLAAQRDWPAGDVVWFAEDDYLYGPQSLRTLVAGAASLRHADYFSLYGSAASGDPDAAAIDGAVWFRGVSTTSSFGVRPRVLSEDLRLLRTMPYAGGAFDHITCLTYQGLWPVPLAELRADLLPFRTRPASEWGRSVARGALRAGLSSRALRRPSRRRILLAASPDPIAHMEDGLTSPATDWAAVAADTVAWAAAHGIAVGPASVVAPSRVDDRA